MANTFSIVKDVSLEYMGPPVDELERLTKNTCCLGRGRTAGSTS